MAKALRALLEPAPRRAGRIYWTRRTQHDRQHDPPHAATSRTRPRQSGRRSPRPTCSHAGGRPVISPPRLDIASPWTWARGAPSSAKSWASTPAPRSASCLPKAPWTPPSPGRLRPVEDGTVLHLEHTGFQLDTPMGRQAFARHGQWLARGAVPDRRRPGRGAASVTPQGKIRPTIRHGRTPSAGPRPALPRGSGRPPAPRDVGYPSSGSSPSAQSTAPSPRYLHRQQPQLERVFGRARVRATPAVVGHAEFCGHGCSSLVIKTASSVHPTHAP